MSRDQHSTTIHTHTLPTQSGSQSVWHIHYTVRQIQTVKPEHHADVRLTGWLSEWVTVHVTQSRYHVAQRRRLLTYINRRHYCLTHSRLDTLQHTQTTFAGNKTSHSNTHWVGHWISTPHSTSTAIPIYNPLSHCLSSLTVNPAGDYIQQHTSDTVLLTPLINLSVPSLRRHLTTNISSWQINWCVALMAVTSNGFSDWLTVKLRWVLSIITTHRRCYNAKSSLHSTTLWVSDALFTEAEKSSFNYYSLFTGLFM